jgi:peptidyl-prolyl isomerase E (cyclophilin E)
MQMLHAACIPFGDIVDVNMPMDWGKDTKHRGFAFVEFESAEDAAACIDNLNDSEMFGRALRVNLARPPKATERSMRPVWADDEWLKQYGTGDEREQINAKESVTVTESTCSSAFALAHVQAARRPPRLHLEPHK